MTPLEQKLDKVCMRLDKNNDLMRGILGARIVHSSYFSTEILKNQFIIAAIFAVIIVAAFTIKEYISYVALAGVVVALIPVVIINRTAKKLFNGG